jgi:hypothetical protein
VAAHRGHAVPRGRLEDAARTDRLREPFDAIEVLGTSLSPRVQEALEAAGFVRIGPTQTGFRARR